jgi:DeoR family deoxyribose operon repressor
MYNKHDRLEKILHYLKLENASSIKALSTQLSVSEMTIRRDLSILAEKGLIKMLHGGAVYTPHLQSHDEEKPYVISEASMEHTDKKQSIGKTAFSLVEQDDIIIVDSGSTTEWLAKYIPNEFPLTVLCYALNILIELSFKKPSKLAFGGGDFHENTLVFESPEMLELIKRFRANKAFISASGVNNELGITCGDPYEIEIKKAVLRSSLDKILLVDSSKFGVVRSCYFAELTDFTTIITDNGISEEYRKRITDSGIKLIVT